MWKPKEVKITTAEICRTFVNLPSMPIPSSWPFSIRELRLPSSPCLRDHTSWQCPAFVLLAALKERSKVNDSVRMNTLFTKEALRAVREMETAWQNLDVTQQWTECLLRLSHSSKPSFPVASPRAIAWAAASPMHRTSLLTFPPHSRELAISPPSCGLYLAI